MRVLPGLWGICTWGSSRGGPPGFLSAHSQSCTTTKRGRLFTGTTLHTYYRLFPRLEHSFKGFGLNLNLRPPDDKVEHQDDPRQVMSLGQSSRKRSVSVKFHSWFVFNIFWYFPETWSRKPVRACSAWWPTLNCVPNQKDTTVSLLNWAQTYSTDMISGIISSCNNKHMSVTSSQQAFKMFGWLEFMFFFYSFFSIFLFLFVCFFIPHKFHFTYHQTTHQPGSDQAHPIGNMLLKINK